MKSRPRSSADVVKFIDELMGHMLERPHMSASSPMALRDVLNFLSITRELAAGPRRQLGDRVSCFQRWMITERVDTNDVDKLISGEKQGMRAKSFRLTKGRLAHFDRVATLWKKVMADYTQDSAKIP